jgi:phospholipid/cholesterol/gamma-HCH transport system substrate-binding protein
MSGMRGQIVRVVALVVVAVVFAAGVIVVYGNVRFESARTYTALFTDASGVRDGDDIRIAGVTVGRVEAVELGADNLAHVEFTVRERTPVLQGSEGVVRYKNLIGQRFVEITEGTGSTDRLEDGGTIPVTQTRPALDLDELYNGFAPLFDGLQPAQINELSGSIINVLQGQAGAVTTLLTQVSSLTRTLADRDAVIGALITNLNSVLDTVNGRRDQVSDLVVQLQELISGLARERDGLGTSLVQFDRLTGTVADVLSEARPDLRGNIAEVDRLSRVINADQEQLNLLLQEVPGYYQVLGRLGIYQSAFHFYLCGVKVTVRPLPSTDWIETQEPRCQY